MKWEKGRIDGDGVASCVNQTERKIMSFAVEQTSVACDMFIFFFHDALVRPP